MPPTRKQRQGRRSPNPGRVAAAKALVHVEKGGHVEDYLVEAAPEGDDRRFAWFLALGVLRRMSRVDAAIQRRLTQPLQGLDPEVRATLRVGAFECLFARTKRYAAVDEAVEVVKTLGAGRARGLVNAVLRRVDPSPDLTRSEHLDHPAWLVARWDERYGPEASTAWCEANGEPPPLAIVARHDPMALAGLLEAQGLVARAHEIGGEVIEGVLRVTGLEGSVEQLPGFEEGAWWVQDPASVWMVDLVEGSSGRVLDACAAPGGKSMRLLARGFEVVPVDSSARRIERMQSNFERMGWEVAPAQHDWLTGSMPGGELFDAVVVDAPCSGLGTVRRHPEIRWRRTPEDLVSSAVAQLSILTAAAAHVREGGSLVYIVCSSEPEEGTDVVANFLGENPAFSLDVERSTAPPPDHEDAFYGARLIRR